jgi:hypothetical protein
MTNSLVPIQEIESKLAAIELSKLKGYVDKLSSIEEAVNTNLAPTMMRDFIMAQDLATVMLARAIQAEMMAKSAVDTASAIALLDKSEEYFSTKGRKSTADLREAYVNLDSDVLSARDLHAKATAMVTILKNRVYEFRSAFDAVKQIYKDSRQTAWEGN